MSVDKDFKILKPCPGDYCGRMLLPAGNFSECGACPRGYRRFNTSQCELCDDQPIFYNWLYLTFMAALPLFYHWYYIDYKVTNRQLSRKLIISAILETMTSSAVTLLLMDPMGTIKLNSCPIKSIHDWYTFLYNPAPNYEDYIYCNQEVVYPLYTMIFVFYIFSVLSLLLIRPWFMKTKLGDFYTALSTLYAGLYLYPILGAVHAVCCGFIYYMFPYLIIIVSVISNAVHFAVKLDQSMSFLIKDTITSSRNLFIVMIHWLCHAFGIIGITQLTNPLLHYPLLCLVPVPTLFYIITSRLTDPRKLHAE